MKKTILLILLIFLNFASFSQSLKNFPHKVILKDIDGNKVSSTTFYNFNKPIIIDFWATYCKPCIIKMDLYKKIYKEWQDKYDAKIISISIDEKKHQKNVLKLIKNRKWPFQFYFDENKELLRKLSSRKNVPQSLILDDNFNIQSHITGGIYFIVKDNKRSKFYLVSDYEDTLKKITKINQ